MTERHITESAIIRLVKKHYAGCCYSCHDDMDNGYAAGIELDLGKGRWGEVCCKVSAAYSEFVKNKSKV